MTVAFEFEGLPDFSIDNTTPSIEAQIEAIPVPKTEVEAISYELEEKKQAKQILLDSIAPTEAQIKELEAKADELAQQLQELRAATIKRKNELMTGVWDIKQQIRELNAEISQLERKLQLALDKQQKSEAFQQKLMEFSKLGMNYKWCSAIKEHQISGAQIMAVNGRTILGDKMGLGKSITSLAAADLLQSQRLLIVAPADVVSNFAKELMKWAPHRMAVSLHNMAKTTRNAMLGILATQSSYTVLVNYEIWRKDTTVIEKLKELRFDTVILDEAHNLKNPSTDAFKGVHEIVMAENCCPKCSGPVVQRKTGQYSYVTECTGKKDWNSNDGTRLEYGDRCSVKNVFPMTGTPILNRPQELFPLLKLILPRVFTREHDFLELYCTRNQNTGYWQFQPGATDRLSHHLAGRYIARDRSALPADAIPPQDIQEHDIEFDTDKYAQQYEIITQLSRNAQIMLENGKEMSVLATIALITRKRQANVWPAGIQLKDEEGTVIFSVGDECQESMKMDYAIDLLKDAVDGGERAVLFSQFSVPLHVMQKRLTALGIRATVMDGQTTDRVRQLIKTDFDRSFCDQIGYEKQWDVVLCNFKTGGVGLNFTGATQMVILDEAWNPGSNDQAYARIDRLGQTESTTVHVLRMNRTIDTWMANLNAHKKNVVSGFDTTGKELTNDILGAMQRGEMI